MAVRLCHWPAFYCRTVNAFAMSVHEVLSGEVCLVRLLYLAVQCASSLPNDFANLFLFFILVIADEYNPF